MTEPERPVDPLDELASAILDGEAAPAEQERAGEPAVAERLARFGRVAAALGEPVEVTAAEREAAVRAALAAAGSTEGPVDELAARRRRSPARRWLPAAAAVLVVAGAIGLAAAGGDDAPDATVAAQLDQEESGDDEARTEGRVSDGAYAEGDMATDTAGNASGGGTAGAALLAGSDLGAFATVDELAAAVAVASSYGALSEESAATTTSLAPACRPQRDGEILFHATATVDDVPLVVFVVATPDGDRLLAYALDGCGERYDLAA